MVERDLRKQLEARKIKIKGSNQTMIEVTDGQKLPPLELLRNHKY